jgi:hypothetical protein
VSVSITTPVTTIERANEILDFISRAAYIFEALLHAHQQSISSSVAPTQAAHLMSVLKGETAIPSAQ